MNDWYNDPPEQAEIPECCGEEMTDFPDGICLCSKCGRLMEPYPDYGDPELPDDPRDIEGDYLRDEMLDREETEDDYDYAADDLAYDAARERN